LTGCGISGRRRKGSKLWRGRLAATWHSSRILRPRFAAGGVSKWSRFLSRNPFTLCWFVRRSA
jgi:hypothetical protein